MRPKESLFYVCNSYAEYYENYPQITTVVFSMDLYKYDTAINQKMKEIMAQRYGMLLELVRKGQECGEIHNRMDADQWVDIIWGLIWSTIFTWKMRDRCFRLKERINTLLGHVIN